MSTLRLRLRNLAEFLVLAVCVAAFLFTAMGVIVALFGPGAAGSRDFIEYWASGHQLTHGANPYDAKAILQLERSAGFSSSLPTLVMGNPPSALPLVLPLGLLSPGIGELLWLLLLFASLLASVQMIRTMHGRPKNLAYLLAYSFAPVLTCILTGQVSLFILLGLVLFLRLHRSRPFLAGASLWFCLLKPHLFLPFGIVLLLWIVCTSSYKILAGAASALAMSSALITLVDPLVWGQYSNMMHSQRLDRIYMPSVAPALRHYVAPHTLWLQCLPAALGCVWAIAYFLKRRDRWNWLEDSPILLLASVFVAPYSFFFDQAILIPALLHQAYLTRSRSLISVLALISAIIEIGALRGATLYSPLYLWTAPAWLIWYLCAVKFTDATAQSNLVQPRRRDSKGIEAIS